jgi:ornithine--oxo-acid transaminase
VGGLNGAAVHARRTVPPYGACHRYPEAAIRPPSRTQETGMTATSDRPARSAAMPAQAPGPGSHAQPAPVSRLAPNYHPLPVTIRAAQGAWVTDIEGRRYLDCLAAYSALNFGHAHPVLLAAAHAQLDRLTLTSRAFLHDQLEAFAEGLSGLADRASRACGGPAMDMVLPMNTGAEAVETAIKMSRKWGYDVLGVPPDRATIVVADGNFHGRTTTIISFSSDPVARDGFGPFTPGFRSVPYGDAAALEAAMDGTVVAVLIEPIQGEAGVIVPPPGYLAAVRATCDRHGALFVADEIQSGLGRVGTTFACERESVAPDAFILGKALGGGIVPVSAVVSRAGVLGVLTAGTHGSTFGGNPLACAVGRAVVGLLETGEYQERSRVLGEVLHGRLRELIGHGVVAVRGAGLWAGVDVDPALGTGRDVCERLAAHGVLAKDTHGSTIRLAPPLVIDEADLHGAVDRLVDALTDLRSR